MATVFKTFLNNDAASTRTMLHESVPITGSIISGTYADANIKNYSHGLFQSVYDYPYLSSSANHIFDITCGYANTSPLSASAVTDGVAASDIKDKISMYNQMAQVLAGHDVDGNILEFDQDGNIAAGGTKLDAIYVLNFARLLAKDEIKKGSFTLQLATGSTNAPVDFSELLTISDYGAINSYYVNSPAAEYGILYTSSADIAADGTSGVGLLYYQAGIAVITASVFDQSQFYSSGDTYSASLSASSIETNADGVRNRMYNVEFNNTTELNSSIYFCRVNHNEYNYSANPTYLSSSKIVVKEQTTDAPVSYVTTVGLYSADNELLAVAKLSEPLKKDPNNELILRVRLDY
jgi:hypothetical protein